MNEENSSSRESSTQPEPLLDTKNKSEKNIKTLINNVFLKHKKWLLISINILVAFIILSFLAYGAMNNKSVTNKSTEMLKIGVEGVLDGGKSGLLNISTAFADKYIPNFDGMLDYAENGNDHWYVTSKNLIHVNGNDYGIISVLDFPEVESFFNIELLGDDVWVSTDNGLVKYSRKSQKTTSYLTDITDIDELKLYTDKYSGVVYASFWENSTGTIYRYDKETDEFTDIASAESSDGINDLAFTKDYIISANFYHSNGSSPISIFNKSTNKWTAIDDLKYSSNGSWSSVKFMQFDDSVLIIGSVPGYDHYSCNKLSGSILYSFKSGKFTEETELGKQFEGYYAKIYDSESGILLGSSTTCKSEQFVIDISHDKNGAVMVNNRRTVKELPIAYYQPIIRRIDQLEKEFGYSPKIILKGVNMDGSVASVWRGGSSIYTERIALVDIDFDKKITSTPLINFEGHYDDIDSVKCGGFTYFITKGFEGNSGRQYLDAIYKAPETSEPTIVYQAINKQKYEWFDAELLLIRAKPICLENNVVLLGVNSISIFDTATKKLTQKPHEYSIVNDQISLSSGESSFVFVSGKNSKSLNEKNDYSLIELTNNSNNAKNFNISAVIDKVDETTSLSVMGINKDNVFILQDAGVDDKSDFMLYVISRNDGSLIKKVAIGKDVSWVDYADNYGAIVRYDSGKIQLFDHMTFQPKTILEKSFGFMANNHLSSCVISKDGYLWVDVSGWGLIAYKI